MSETKYEYGLGKDTTVRTYIGLSPMHGELGSIISYNSIKLTSFGLTVRDDRLFVMLDYNKDYYDELQSINEESHKVCVIDTSNMRVLHEGLFYMTDVIWNRVHNFIEVKFYAAGEVINNADTGGGSHL